MWHLLEVLMMPIFSSSLFLAILQIAKGKEAEDAQTTSIFMEQIWLLTSYSESAGFFVNGFISSSYSWALFGILQWFCHVEFLVCAKVNFHDASGPSEDTEHYSMLLICEKLAENYLWGFYLSSQLRLATGFKCAYTCTQWNCSSLASRQNQAMMSVEAARNFSSEILQTDRLRSRVCLQFDFSSWYFFLRAAFWRKWWIFKRKILLKVLFILVFFPPKYHPLNITKHAFPGNAWLVWDMALAISSLSKFDHYQR